MTQTPARVPPLNRYGSVRSNVSVTHPKTGGRRKSSLKTWKRMKRPSVVTDADQHHCLWTATTWKDHPEDTPLPNMWPSGITRTTPFKRQAAWRLQHNATPAKQPDRGLFGPAPPQSRSSCRTTWSDNQLHHAAKQLDDNTTADADADADAGDALKSRERILSAPQRMYTQNNGASKSSLWRSRRRIKSALFPREPRPLLLAVQPTIACLTWSSNTRTDASDFND